MRANDTAVRPAPPAERAGIDAAAHDAGRSRAVPGAVVARQLQRGTIAVAGAVRQDRSTAAQGSGRTYKLSPRQSLSSPRAGGGGFCSGATIAPRNDFCDSRSGRQ
jgi:hypothetical protein